MAKPHHASVVQTNFFTRLHPNKGVASHQLAAQVIIRHAHVMS